MVGIGEFIKARQADGAADGDILAEVRRAFPEARTTLNSVRWYRSQANKEGGRTRERRESAPPTRRTPRMDGGVPPSMDGLRPGDRGFYYVDGVRTFAGIKARGFNATLHAGGAKVAEVIDEGGGEGAIFHFLDEEADRVEVRVPDWEGAERVLDVSPLEAHWLRHVAALPRELRPEHPGETTHVPPDVHLASLVDDALVARRLQRLTRDHLVFLSGGKLMQVKLSGLSVAKLSRSVEQKHPGARVLNGMPLSEAIRLVP